MTEAEVCLLMSMARWRAIEEIDPTLASLYTLAIPWMHLFKYLSEVYRERAHALITTTCRHLFLMSAASPDLLIHLVLPNGPTSQLMTSSPPSPATTALIGEEPIQGTDVDYAAGDVRLPDATGGTGQPRLYLCRRQAEPGLDQVQEEEDMVTLVNTLCVFLTRTLVTPTNK